MPQLSALAFIVCCHAGLLVSSITPVIASRFRLSATHGVTAVLSVWRRTFGGFDPSSSAALPAPAAPPGMLTVRVFGFGVSVVPLSVHDDAPAGPILFHAAPSEA